uniref:60S ribosomal protein L28 n=1 Tax=Macrostomum lignano TaxID=282301 RepID=A0A1I8FEF1_9PLAT
RNGDKTSRKQSLNNALRLTITRWPRKHQATVSQLLLSRGKKRKQLAKSETVDITDEGSRIQTLGEEQRSWAARTDRPVALPSLPTPNLEVRIVRGDGIRRSERRRGSHRRQTYCSVCSYPSCTESVATATVRLKQSVVLAGEVAGQPVCVPASGAGMQVQVCTTRLLAERPSAKRPLLLLKHLCNTAASSRDDVVRGSRDSTPGSELNFLDLSFSVRLHGKHGAEAAGVKRSPSGWCSGKQHKRGSTRRCAAGWTILGSDVKRVDCRGLYKSVMENPNHKPHVISVRMNAARLRPRGWRDQPQPPAVSEPASKGKRPSQARSMICLQTMCRTSF